MDPETDGRQASPGPGGTGPGGGAAPPAPAAAERITFLSPAAADPFADDGPNVIANLSRTPKRIAPMYVYDKHGTELFEQQCGTPEYYLRRAEFRLLSRHAPVIVEVTGYPAIVELGAGTAEKTRILLAKYVRRRVRCDYFPIDVDADTLRESAAALVADHPELYVNCVCAEYRSGLRALPPLRGPRLFAFLGSSLGNMEWPEARELLSALFEAGRHGDFLLLGADLDKDAAIIDRAYNDAAGYGARSTLNMLAHLNRRFDGDFHAENFRYVSRYDAGARRNEARIESRVGQRITLRALDFSFELTQGESIDAEIMLKFDPDELTEALGEAGFATVRRWIDPVYRYGLFLLVRQ
jgi:dimethylhistidine N-methyltransferase